MYRGKGLNVQKWDSRITEYNIKSTASLSHQICYFYYIPCITILEKINKTSVDCM